MAQYIGQAPINGFHAKQSLTGDGSTTAFTLDQTVASETSMIVSVGGVLQEPTVAYNLTTGGTKISFTEAPSSTDTVYIHFLGKAIVQNVQDLAGAEFVLDDDGDTSFTADTDDEIDIRVGGTDRSTIKATGFHNLDSIKFVAGTGDDMQMYHDGTNSYLTNSTGALKLATETSGIAITLGHTTSEVTIADNLTVAGDMTVTGVANFADANITNVGSIALDTITNDGTDVTIDSSGDINLDAGGADIVIKDDGTEIGRFTNSSSDLILKTTVSDKDLIIQGNDGGSTITALTLDMSAAGAATFNDKIIATELDISGNMDIDGTSNLDAVDIDGAVQIDGATTFGVDDTGVDVKFFGATSGAYLLWDESADKLLTAGGTVIDIVKDKLLIGGTAVTTTATELNKLDGATVTVSEINIIDGNTSATSTTVADADRVVMNDNGTMVQVAVTDLAAYFDDEITAMPNLTSVGTLTALTVDDIAVDGKVITMTGSSSDTAVFTAAANGALSIVTTDDAGAAANIQITADGTAEMAGTTVTLDSSGGITLDADGGTITFADAGSSLGTITSSGYSGTAAVATAVTVTDNESTNENNVLTFVAGADTDGGNVGLESDGDLTYNPSTGTLSCTNLVTSGTHTVTNSVEMTASSTVVFEGATADAHETTLGAIDATGDRAINLPNVAGTLPVLAAVSATAITSTPEELNILDGATVVVGEINALDLGSTAVGTAIASKAVILDSNKDYTGVRNFTTTGTVEAGGKITADAGIDIDNFNIDGTTIALSSGDMVLDSAADIILDAGGADVVFKDDGTQIGLFTMDSSNLTLQSSVSDKDLIFKGNDGGSTITALTLDMSASGQATFNNDVFSAGKFGLNDGDYINHVDNTRKEFVVNGNEEMRLEADGDLHVDNDVIAFSSTISDERLKTDITVVENALDKVEQIRGVEFTRTHNDSRSAGVIAQEVEKILPCAVIEKKLPLQTGDEDTLYKTVHYDALHALMIESIKELSSKVKELEKKLEEK